MDELLHSRVEQLREILERVQDIRRVTLLGTPAFTEVNSLIHDLHDMIAAAEREHAKF